MSVPVTRPSLLRRLVSPKDEAAWRDFVELYTPLLLSHFSQRGLQQTDAEDVAQNTMRRVFLALPSFEYRPHQARFSTWLYRVAENQLKQFLRHRQRKPLDGGSTTTMRRAEHYAAAEAETNAETAWKAAWEQRLFLWAVKNVEPEFSPNTWAAFCRTALQNESPEAVADQLGTSKAAVYMAKSRCIARIREWLSKEASKCPLDHVDLPEEALA